MSRIQAPRSTRPWQRFLTPEERSRLQEIDRAIKKASGDLKVLRSERNKIQNRATVRASQ